MCSPCKGINTSTSDSEPLPQTFAGKNILITGATEGTGLAICHYLAARGANLIMADIGEAPVVFACHEITQNYPVRAIASVLDCSCTESVNKTFLHICIEFGGELHGAVNNAGILGKLASLQELQDDEWIEVNNVNAGGVMRCLREELKIMGEEASIVNISSMAGLKGFEKAAAFVASKHAVVGLTKVAAKEGARKGRIRVNAICPGVIDTVLLKDGKETGRSDDSSISPMGRFGQPEEIAALVGYLLGPESRYISGACIPVDGAACSV